MTQQKCFTKTILDRNTEMVDSILGSQSASNEVTIDPKAPIKRQSIQGYVTLKRKAIWVKRFATIKTAMFSYSKDQGK